MNGWVIVFPCVYHFLGSFYSKFSDLEKKITVSFYLIYFQKNIYLFCPTYNHYLTITIRWQT